MLKLIYDIDSSPEFFSEEILDESTGLKEKKYYIKGIFSTINEVNRNGRKYPMNLWGKVVESYQQNFTNGSINSLMEYEHPPRSSVDPMEAVAKMTSLKIDGNYVIGEAVLLDNQKANQLKSLIDNKIKINVSSRGLGSVKNGIVENFKLITYDIVAEPSDYNASMNGMCESYQLNEGIINDLAFTLDEFGNIIQMNKYNDSNQIFEKKDVDSAILSKFTEILNNFKQ